MSRHVSVIIPVYNDPEGVNETLESVCNQTYDQYTVVPVDNNSTDNTPDILTEFKNTYPELVSPQQEPNVQGSYAARNTGIKNTSSEILLFLDADMWVEETWIEEMVSTLESYDCDYLGCNVEVVTNDHPTVWEVYEQSLSFPVRDYLESERFAPTCALAVRRKVFDEVGLFDHRLESGGDNEFGKRVHRAGFKQWYAANVTAYHPARSSWDALRSKALRIGRGRAQMRAFNPHSGVYPHPLHPTHYLPPNPFRLRRQFAGYEVATHLLVAFYVLEYVLKLYQAYGTAHESAALWRSNHGTK